MSARTRGCIFGGVTAALGALWLGPGLLPLFPLFLDSEHSLALKVSMLPVLLLMLAPGALLIGFGIQICREATVPRVNWALGTFLILAALIAAAQMQRAFPSLETRKALDYAITLAVTVAAIAAYGPLVRWMLAFLNLPLPQPFHVVGRGLLLLLAFELWFFLSALSEPPLSRDPGWRFFLGAFGPLVAAIAFYEISALLLTRSRQRSAEPPLVTHDP